MKGMTLNSMPAGMTSALSPPVQSPIKKRNKKLDMMMKSSMNKGPGVAQPAMPFGGMLRK